ncbi:hypothetical protein IJ596_05565 [bacterium]|nr:hypothetical protein [bacterium]
MKKLIFISLFAVLFICAQVFAAVVTERKIYNEPAPAQNRVQSGSQAPVSVTREKQRKFANALKNCQPYTEHMDSDYLGMNMSFDLRIIGWVNNKCKMAFDANTKGASSSFSGMYGIDPSQAEIYSFAPKIRCEFTKQQLEYAGDSILQENERSAGNVNMLKDPNSINISPNLSSSDMRLLDVILNQGACTILNLPDLDNVLQMLNGATLRN